jgi:hypothetical protein
MCVMPNYMDRVSLIGGWILFWKTALVRFKEILRDLSEEYQE